MRVEELGAYVAADRLRAMLAGEEPPSQPTGAAVFADVSGFTRLTLALVEELGAQRGAEELTGHLNRVYDALIGPVHRYRGSVISFAGDAITCWFGEDTGLRAAACALEMVDGVRAMGALRTPRGASLPVRARLGIAAGPTRRFAVGDPRHQRIDVLAGRTLDRMSQAASLAAQNEILLEADLGERLAADLRVGESRAGSVVPLQGLLRPCPADPWPVADLSALGEQQLRPWLLPAVFERLRAGHGGFMAELRTTTALFVRIGSLDYDGDPEVVGELDAWIQRVQDTLERFGGSLLSFTTGDKGNSVYANFGALVSHEDDCERAVGAALALAASSSDLPRIGEFQMGISQGRMRTGAYGSRSRRTYGSLGPDTNLAARLMDRATPGQVLVSERVARAAAQRFEFADLGKLRAKGFDEPLPVLEVRGRRARVGGGGRGEPIGRSAERARLAEPLAALERARRGGALFVSGDAGIGKSRLAADLVERARARGVPALGSAAEAIDRASPYFAWREIFAQLLGLDPRQAGDEPARRAVEERLAERPELLARAPLLGPVLSLDLPDNSLTAQMTGPVRADNTHALLARLLEDGAREAGLLVLIDDAQWMDSASWGLALRVVQRTPSVLLVLVHRPLDEPPPEYERLGAEEAAERVELGPMSDAETRELVERRLGLRGLPTVLASFVTERAQGNPFFAEELADTLRDRGMLRISEGACEIVGGEEALADCDFPGTIAGVVTARIDQLSSVEQIVLKVASVVGRSFPVDALLAADPVGVGRDELLGGLRELARRDILRVESHAPEGYVFKHTITHQVVYERLLFEQRRGLHERVARWYEGADGADFPVLAHHWGEAQVVEKQTHYLDLAGEHALRAGAFAEAHRFHRTLLEIARGEPRTARWEWGLGQALNGLGRLREARDHLERAAGLYGQPLPRGRGARLLGLAGQLTRQGWRRITSSEPGPRRLSAPASGGLEIAKLYRDLIDIYWYTDEKLLHLYCAARLLNEAERAGPCFELAQGYITFSVLAGVGGLPRMAEAYYRRALAVAESLGQESALAFVQLGSGIYRVGLGQWARAERDVSEALRSYEHLGNEKRWTDCAVTLGARHLQIGRLDAAQRLLRDVLPRAVHAGNAVAQQHALLGLGGAALLAGHLDRAARQLEEALALIEASGEDVGHIACLGMLATARWWRGERDEAVRLARAAAERIARNGAVPNGYYAIYGYVAAAEIPLSLWEEAGEASAMTRKQTQRSCRALRTYTRLFPIGAPATWRCRGRLLSMRGRPAAARRAWLRSLAEAERLEMPFEEARAHFELGRHLAPGDPRREQHLARAALLFDGLGGVAEGARVHAILAREAAG